jgi:hypothetical protein
MMGFNTPKKTLRIEEIGMALVETASRIKHAITRQSAD